MMKEIWADVKGYEGLYQVSNLGRVKSLDRRIPSKLRNQVNVVKKGKILSQNCNNNSGYFKVVLAKDGRNANCLVHRLVADAFLQNNDNKPQVNHKDGNKKNNIADNLEWCTSKENTQHAFATGLCEKAIALISTKVEQYNGKTLIKVWNSFREIERATGMSASYICQACKTDNRAYGYIWRYADE